MNTKQILFNALSAQLQERKNQYDQYEKEVYEKEFSDLSNEIESYMDTLFPGLIKSFSFQGSSINMNTRDNGWRNIEFSIKNDWRSDASERYVDMTWGGDNIDKNSNDDDINYLKLLSSVAIHYQTIFNSYLNEWYPKYMEIHNREREKYNEYNELQTALNNLSNEISNDAKEKMKQKIGRAHV